MTSRFSTLHFSDQLEKLSMDALELIEKYKAYSRQKCPSVNIARAQLRNLLGRILEVANRRNDWQALEIIESIRETTKVSAYGDTELGPLHRDLQNLILNYVE